jgi:hypothetical protein
MKAKAMTATCKNRMRTEKKERKKKAFLSMNKGNFIFVSCLE